MFSLNSRPRSHSQSFPSIPYRAQDYYLSPTDHVQIISPASPHTFAAERNDLYAGSSSDLGGTSRRSHAPYDSGENLSAPYHQPYDRCNSSPTDLRLPSSATYHSQSEEDHRPVLPNLPQHNRGEIITTLHTHGYGSPHSTFLPEPESALTAHSDHSGDSEFWPNAVQEHAPNPPRPKKARREKPRIELAPDQPPTTQGKPRARVYVACLQCRTRKIRCDGAKPACHNCSRRTNANNECNYDPVPKRRGPDKTPGARQRMARDARNEVNGDILSTRRRRRTRDMSTAENPPQQSHPIEPRQTPNSNPMQLLSIPPSIAKIELPTAELSSMSNLVRPYSPECGCHGLIHCPILLEAGGPSNRKSSASLSPYSDAYDLATMIPSYNASTTCGSHVLEVDESGTERSDSCTFEIASEPSLTFTRKIWWDSLLSLYLSPGYSHPQIFTTSQRDAAARTISADLRFIFRESNYWFSFFHMPSFFGNFFDPARREWVQPSVVLALLAMSIFWQSPEVGLGSRGRERALRFRDEAQSALEASFNAGWVDETLAQAAWLLALFEVCAHPRHSSERVRSAMMMLDSIIRSLSLTLVDADDASTSVFPPGSVPTVRSQKFQPSIARFSDQPPIRISRDTSSAQHPSLTRSNGEDNCSCNSMTLRECWPTSREHTPLWGATPAWNEGWSEGEIRKESCRRLCWSSSILAAGHVSYTMAHRSKGLDLFISNPANYALLFSGESVARSPSFFLSCSSKDTIWALHDRCYLLWHACIHTRLDTRATDSEKANFAIKAWLEADAIELALNKHTCTIERAFIFQAREYIFNTRMCISYEFQRFIPLATANMNSLFHRHKAEEWLTHQAAVAQRFMLGLRTITGNSANLLARRPFFVFWFMGQIYRALSLWQCDNTLVVALDVCKALLPPIDYLTALWPCPEQRCRYENLRKRLDDACYFAGVSLAPPSNLTLPDPSSPQDLV